MTDQATQLAVQTARELGELKGQLTQIAQLIQATHESTNQRIDAAHAATNQRIDDYQKSNEARMDSHEKRIGTLEQNERATAIKAAAIGATAGALSGFLGQIAGAVVKAKTGIGG